MVRWLGGGGGYRIIGMMVGSEGTITNRGMNSPGSKAPRKAGPGSPRCPLSNHKGARFGPERSRIWDPRAHGSRFLVD